MMRLARLLLLASPLAGAGSPKPAGFGQRPIPWIEHDVPRDFANPVGLARPAFRYWVPDADVDDDVLYADIKNMHGAGWGSVEVICLENYGIQPAVVDPAEYGYGGPLWAARFTTMLRAAAELNMTVDFALGPTQGASIPVLDPDSEGMSTELVYGQVNITAGSTYAGPLPPPRETRAAYANEPEFYAPVQNYTNRFVAAVAARKSAAASKDARVTRLDLDTVHEVTALASSSNGSIAWTAPDDGHEWTLLAFYQRRTGYLAAQGAWDNATDANNPASWFAYVVDHFSQAGTDLWTGFTERFVMNGANGDLLRRLGLYAWEDSAEFTATLFWTDDLRRIFNRSRGYDIVPVLPVLFGTTGLPPSTLENGYFHFSFDDERNPAAHVDGKMRNDFYQALQDLYETHHLDGLSAWSSQWGLQGSLQPYATFPNRAPPWDMVSAAAHIDAPETESNYFDGVIDAVRAMAGGAMMGNKQVFSSELGAHRHFAYAATWPLIANDCAISYAGGVNRIAAHGYPYSGYRRGAEWPGLTTFEWRYSDMWGPRQPSWAAARDVADWIARTQLVLQTGVPRVDVGIYRHKYLSVDIKHYGMGESIFGHASLQNAGYSYISVSPSLLTRDNAVVRNRRLAEDGPALAALIVDNSTNITTEALSRLAEYADQGFAILFVGPLPELSPYYDPSGAADAQVRRGIRDLLATRPSVKHLGSEAAVVDALRALHVRPAAENLTPAPILYTHRWDAANAVDYYWVYNSDIHARHATAASLRGRGLPYALDAWTGAITPIVNYTTTESGDRFTLWFDLRSNQSTIVALAPEGFFRDVALPGAHIVSSDVPYARFSTSSGELVARSTLNASHDIALSNGRNYTLPAAPTLPPAVELGPWNLTIEDWRPGPDPTRDYAPALTYHHYANLDALVPWYNISQELRNVSGIGTYTAAFTWPPPPGNNVTAPAGALLDLGPVFNTVKLWVNDESTGVVDLTDARVDVGPFLVDGTNRVRIETASTLRNRLIQVNVSQSWEQSEYAGAYGRQPYGLSGPVVLIPYKELRLPV